MNDGRRYLLGREERLTAPVSVPHGMNPPEPSYSRDEAISRLLPQTGILSQTLDTLPQAACPNDEAVATLTPHPQALAIQTAVNMSKVTVATMGEERPRPEAIPIRHFNRRERTRRPCQSIRHTGGYRKN